MKRCPDFKRQIEDFKQGKTESTTFASMCPVHVKVETLTLTEKQIKKWKPVKIEKHECPSCHQKSVIRSIFGDACTNSDCGYIT